MAIYCFYVMVISYKSSWHKLEELDTSIRKAYHHWLCLWWEYKLGNLKWIVSSPYSNIPVRFFLQFPALNGSQWQNKFSILLILPWKFGIGNSSIKFFQGTIIPSCKDNIILSIIHIDNNFPIIIIFLFDFKLSLKFGFID